MGDYKYVRVVFFKTLPLWLFSLILLFFTIYQLMIGNPFLEDIHPVIVLGFFFLVSFFVSAYLSVFSFRLRKGIISIRLGYYRVSFELKDMSKLGFSNEYENRDITYGVSFGVRGEVFLKIDNVVPLEIVVADGRKILVFEKGMNKVLDFIFSLNLEVER